MAGPATNQNATAYLGQDAVITFAFAGDGSGWTYEYRAQRKWINAATPIIQILNAAITAVHSAGTTTVTVPITAAQMTVGLARYAHTLARIDSGDVYALADGELWVVRWAYNVG